MSLIARTRRALVGALERADPLDQAVDRAWEPLRGRPGVDRWFYGASAIGDHGMVWLALGAAFAPRSALHKRSAQRLAVGLAIESILVNGAIKGVFRRERPVQVTERPMHLRIPITSSFPSGHASSAVFAAMLLSDADPRLRRPLQVLAASVALSRLHVRIHHASDVAGGVAVGWALGHAARRLAPLEPVAPIER